MIASGSIGRGLPAGCQISEILSQKRKNPNLWGIVSSSEEFRGSFAAASYLSHIPTTRLQQFFNVVV
jgi:hypothetical protein